MYGVHLDFLSFIIYIYIYEEKEWGIVRYTNDDTLCMTVS